MKTLKYFSMFSGIGGFEYGMQQSKHNFKNVGYSEIDKYARNIYEKHYPNHICFGDATEINTEDLPDFSILIGGFPCQTFSIAGKRAGFNDTRGTMFFELARILRDKKPKYFLFENVKGILSHEGGKTLNRILNILNELGYDVLWQNYNSKYYNVPQNRERIYFKGYFREECPGKVLSIRDNNGKIDFQSKVNTTIDFIGTTNGHQSGNVYSSEGVSPTLCSTDFKRPVKIICNKSDAFESGSVTTKKNTLKIKTNTNKGYDEVTNGDGIRLAHPTSTKARGRTQKKQTGTLSCSDSCDWGTISNYRIRRLTPVECERLQAFPDNYTKYGKNGEIISDTQRYKCIGNAVTTTVVTAIVNQMFDDKGEIK